MLGFCDYQKIGSAMLVLHDGTESVVIGKYRRDIFHGLFSNSPRVLDQCNLTLLQPLCVGL